jgi:hypothetical protein
MAGIMARKALCQRRTMGFDRETVRIDDLLGVGDRPDGRGDLARGNQTRPAEREAERSAARSTVATVDHGHVALTTDGFNG